MYEVPSEIHTSPRAGVQSHSPPQPSDALPARRRLPPSAAASPLSWSDDEARSRHLLFVEQEHAFIAVGRVFEIEVHDLVLQLLDVRPGRKVQFAREALVNQPAPRA